MLTIAGGVILGVVGLQMLAALFGTPEGRIALGLMLKLALLVVVLGVVGLLAFGPQ